MTRTSASDAAYASSIATDEVASSLWAQVHEAYQRRGFDQGYSQAVRDQLAALVLDTESFLQELSDGSPQARQTVYRFVAHLQRRIASLSPHQGYVEGGLGI